MHRNTDLGSRNLSLGHSGCKIIGFYSQNLHSWAQQVSNLWYSNRIVNVIHISHFYNHKFTILNVFTKFYKLEKNNVKSCLIHQSIIDKLKDHYWNMGARNERCPGNKLGGPESWKVPPPWKLYFNHLPQACTNKIKHNKTKAWFRGLLCHRARKWIRTMLPLQGPHRAASSRSNRATWIADSYSSRGLMHATMMV